MTAPAIIPAPRDVPFRCCLCGLEVGAGTTAPLICPSCQARALTMRERLDETLDPKKP